MTHEERVLQEITDVLAMTNYSTFKGKPRITQDMIETIAELQLEKVSDLHSVYKSVKVLQSQAV